MIKSDDRLVLRVPKDLKAEFIALCDYENVTISAKIKNLMQNEVNKMRIQSEYMLRTQKNRAKNDFENIQASTLPQKNKTPVNANTEQINPLFALIDSDTEINYISVEKSSMQSAINAQNKRKPKRKKR